VKIGITTSQKMKKSLKYTIIIVNKIGI